MSRDPLASLAREVAATERELLLLMGRVAALEEWKKSVIRRVGLAAKIAGILATLAAAAATIVAWLW